MITCSSCNALNRDSAKYCSSCGSKLASSSDSSQPGSYLTLHPGMLLQGRYQVLRQIGAGGLGRVFLASDNSGRRYVLKQIREPSQGDELIDFDLALHSFQREASILSSLPHPYLPIARDFIITPDNFIIVMDYIEGKNLADVIEEDPQPLPESRVLTWGSQVCEALSYLHSKRPPIIHRNIKPKNIMLEMGENERVRLIGFGLARYYIQGLERDEDTLGTPGFSPPEQYGKAQTDARSDIFGLGATLYALLSKRDPAEFVHGNQVDQLEFKFPDLHTLNPRVSLATSRLVMKALNLDPNQRFQSAEDMKSAIEEILLKKRSPQPVEKFLLNQPVASEETLSCEFKEIKGDEPVRAITRVVDKYVVAYLNSEGGHIYWGIRDEDRVVVGVRATYRQRDQIRRAILDKIMRIQPSVSPSAYRINFNKVYDGDQPVRDLFVIEIIVPKSPNNLLYFTCDGEVYVKTEAGKKRLTGTEIQDEIIRRLQRSQLHGAFQ